MTIPAGCKRIAEVDFPVATVSRHAAAEKAGARGGHPSTLHVWWARRPLASSRAMLLALLLPDPCDPLCPETFKEEARRLLPRVQGAVGPTGDDLRSALLKFIGDFANWGLSADTTFLEVSRGLVKAAHPGEAPLVVDPFAGGGSIPLEALRVGCEAFASDLNPVACLILKVLLEAIPRHGPDLADEVGRVGRSVREAVEEELGTTYPLDSDGARPVVYLWARTVSCDDCGAEIPLVRSWWLSQVPRRKRALRYQVIRRKGEVPRVEFEVFEPKRDSDVPKATVSRAKAACLCCPSVLAPERVRTQLRAHRGGADVIFAKSGERSGGARLLAVVTVKPGESGRRHRTAIASDYAAVRVAMNRLEKILSAGTSDVAPIPDEPLPLMSGTFNVPIYGVSRWGDMFTARQKLAMYYLSRHIAEAHATDACRELLACALSIFARACNANARLRPDSSVAPAFGMQALPITWTFPETVLTGGRTENFDGAVETVVGVATSGGTRVPRSGQVQLADAVAVPLPDAAAAVWFTDPPYYFAVPYADLSDFFFVWLKRTLPKHPLMRDPFDPTNPLTPKERELCQMAHWDQERYPHKDQAFFESGVAKAFAEGRRVLRDDGIGSVVFAHKTTEGWEALLSGMIRAGWTIRGSWPLATEAAGRLRARQSAALATSIHLVCRPRVVDETGDWIVVRRELPKRVSEWMKRLQAEGVRGADLVFACIGPALEVYSRYTKVVDADDREIPLGGDPEATEPHKRGYLAYVWEVVGRAALEQVLGPAESGALEEDARLTSLFLWTLQTTNGSAEDSDSESEDDEDEAEEDGPSKRGFTLPYDVVRRFAQPLGIHLDRWRGRVIDMDKGIVRLLPVTERVEQLFGEQGPQAAAAELESSVGGRAQMTLFPDAAGAGASKRRKGKRSGGPHEKLADAIQPTTLDRIHAGMLLQRAGKTQALRRLLATEQDRGPDFLRLANALSALYPSGSEEERLLDAMLLAVPR